jgi:hypothetical protein
MNHAEEVAFFDNHYRNYLQKKERQSYPFFFQREQQWLKVYPIMPHHQALITTLYVIFYHIYKFSPKGDILESIKMMDWNSVSWMEMPLLDHLDTRYALPLKTLNNIVQKVREVLGSGALPEELSFISPDIIFSIYVERFQKVDWNLVK